MAGNKQGKRRRQRHGLGLLDVERIKGRLRGSVPSEYWLDIQFVRVVETTAEAEQVVTTWHDPRRFPPQADTTPMLVCRRCGIPTPMSGIDAARRVCLDCHCARNPVAADAWGPSPSATALMAVRWARVRIRELPLAKAL